MMLLRTHYTRVLCVATALVSLCLAGCRSAGVAECTESGECPAPQACNRETRICYTPDPVYSIEITHPAANATLTGPSFTLDGNVLNADQGIASAQFRVADGGWTPLVTTSSGHFEANPPLPTEDGLPLTISVQATDGAGKALNTQVHVIADNVRPIATLTATDQERGHPLNIAVQFSEPVLPSDTDGGVPLVLTPPAGAGTWNASRTEFRIAGLAPDTHYLAQVPANAVRDAANNLNQALQADFRTAPAEPPDGPVLQAPAGQSFDLLEVTSDRDGVVTLAAHVPGPPEQVVWGWFDPKTGGFVSHVVAASNVAGLEVGASVEPGLDSPRFHALTVRDQPLEGGVVQVYWSADGGVQQQLSGALAVVPGPPGCGEPGAPDSVGLVVDAGTPRLQRAGLDLSLVPQQVAYASASDWSLFSVEGTYLKVQSLTYDCDGGTPVAATPVSISGAGVGTFHSAAVDGNALVAYDVGSSAEVACAHCTAGGTSCVSNGFPALRLASMHQGGWVLGARRDLNNQALSFVRADLAPSCPPSWQSGAAVPDSSGIAIFSPAMLGSSPALLYIDANGDISALRSSTP
jgi:hypothetical protein